MLKSPSLSFRYKVGPRSGGGGGDAPSAPVLSNVVAGDGSVSFDIALPDEGETTMHVYRDTEAGATTLLESVDPASSYTDDTAENGTGHFYRVRLEDASGNVSGYSNEVSATPEAPTFPLDAYEDDVEAAYGLSRLLTSYEGDAILVRRSFDDAEEAIGFTASGDLDVVALLAFAGGGDAFVRTLYDQKGLRDHEQTSAALQPQVVAGGSLVIEGLRPALRFGGAAYLTAGSGLDLSAFSVLSVQRAEGTNKHALGLQSSDGNGFRLQVPSTTGVRLRVLGSDVNVTGVDPSVLHVHGGSFGGGTATVYYDGESASASVAGALDTAAYELRMGTGFSTSATWRFDDTIAEQVVFSAVVDLPAIIAERRAYYEGGAASAAEVVAALADAHASYGGTVPTASRSAMGAAFPAGEEDRYNAAVLAPDGKIYCPPDEAEHVLVIDPAAGTAALTDFGLTLEAGVKKWHSAALGPDGKIYGIPGDAEDILIIDPATGTAERADFGIAAFARHKGGTLAGDGKIYCPPEQSTTVLVIDPIAGTAERTDFGLDLSGVQRFFGAALAPDGRVFCAPLNADYVLIIDPATGTATKETFGLDLSDEAKWQGIVLGADGRLYCVPWYAEDVLIIDPVAMTATRESFGLNLAGGSKWQSGTSGPDGKIYCFPRSAINVLVIDPIAGTASRETMGATLTGSSKWQAGAMALDGTIYGVPQDAADILVITNAAASPLAPAVALSPTLTSW